MIENYKQPWLPYLYYIDLRSYEWPWPEEKWDDITGYIIRIWVVDHIPRGLCSFKIVGDTIKVSKLCVNPRWRNQRIGEALYHDLVSFARDHGKTKLIITIHEYNKDGMNWLTKRGWVATGIEWGIFPDGTDGWTFEREIVK